MVEAIEAALASPPATRTVRADEVQVGDRVVTLDGALLVTRSTPRCSATLS